MNPLQRINTILHSEEADTVPFVPYDNLIPRGEFGRELRNRGMVLCHRCHEIWSAIPDVRTETKTHSDIVTTFFHTPAGTVSASRKTHLGRIDDSEGVETEWMIRSIEDYDPVIFMVEHAEFHADYQVYLNKVRDLGTDGIVRGTGPWSPYDTVETYFGLFNWSFEQADHPDHFQRLLEVLTKQEERRFPLVAKSPAEFISFGSLSGFYGPEPFREHVLPFYQKYMPLLKGKGKICALHAHNSNLRSFRDILPETGVQVIEAYTPPPISDLPIDEARKAWGKDIVIWVNFPETIFWHGVEATRQYTLDLLESDPYPDRLVIGMTEMGTYGVTDDESERFFKDGIRAILDAIDDFTGSRNR
jgi:hypothetical protein